MMLVWILMRQHWQSDISSSRCRWGRKKVFLNPGNNSYLLLPAGREAKTKVCCVTNIIDFWLFSQAKKVVVSEYLLEQEEMVTELYSFNGWLAGCTSRHCRYVNYSKLVMGAPENSYFCQSMFVCVQYFCLSVFV